jgi:hypothetical protein
MADIKCPSCQGGKKLLSLGLQYMDCWKCDGKGFIEIKEPEVKEPEIKEEKKKVYELNTTFTTDDLLVPKRRGRKKGVKT